MTEFHVSIGGETYGPVSAKELANWHKVGTFGLNDFVWDETSGEWISAGAVPELAEIFAPAPQSAHRPPPPGISTASQPLKPSSAGEASTGAGAAKVETFCPNHDDRPATTGCPVCRKAYCKSCVGMLDGILVCLDCLARERSRQAPALKRHGLLLTGFAVIACAILSLWFLQETPPPQPETPRKIELPLGKPIEVEQEVEIVIEETKLDATAPGAPAAVIEEKAPAR